MDFPNIISKVSKDSGDNNILINDIEKLVVDISHDIAEMDLSSKHIKTIPSLENFTHLKKLSLSNSCLDTQNLSDMFHNLKQVTTLNLSKNGFTEVPESISNLKNLEYLNLSGNCLTDLPEGTKNLKLLRMLDISCNEFTCIPQCIVNGLELLEVLNVSQNKNIKLNCIPRSIYLKKFIARGNGICGAFPDWIFFKRFVNLEELYLDETEFDFYNCPNNDLKSNLKVLSVSSSRLSEDVFKKLIKNMLSLEIINACDNPFWDIPIVMFNYPYLIKDLNLRGTGLQIVPNTINRLKNLVKLDIGSNNIQWLPNEFCDLESLEILYIDHSNLSSFPENIDNLKSIREIRANSNRLERLPKLFGNLKKLEILDIYDNDFKEIPEQLYHIKTLKGLDIGQNYFTIEKDLKISKIPYSQYLDSIWVLYSINDRGSMPKEIENSDSFSDDSDEYRYSSSSMSDEEYQTKENPNCVFPPKHDENRNLAIDENWDDPVDEDSNDEFDPTSTGSIILEPKKKSLKYGYENTKVIFNKFCPSDLHSKRIKSEVRRMQRYGSLPSDFPVQEGQFDDA